MTLDSPSNSFTLNDFAVVLDSLPIGVAAVDGQGVIRYRNRIASARLGEFADLKSAFADARHLESFPGWAETIAHVLTRGEVVSVPCVLPQAGSPAPRCLTLQCSPLRQPDSPHPYGVVLILFDRSAGDITEEQQDMSRRLASLGRLAARVAHELNNPLDGILRYVNLALRLVNDSNEPKLKNYLSESRSGLLRMVQILGELLQFSRRTEGEFDESSITEVVEQAIRATAAAAETNQVIVAADFQGSAMPAVRGSRLYQVCCNLLKNAIDAMPRGGRLTVTTGIVSGEVVIRVADTGVGLPQDVNKVFEPFYTTKPPGKGTGLGLAICKDYVEEMHGTILAAPGAEGGAVFTVRIPLRSCHVPARGSADPLVVRS